MEIKSLKEFSTELVYKAFVDAFSDYEVQIQMTYDKFTEMMVTRDLNPAYSIGCFDNDRLVGFIITGYRDINGKKYCYDGGTGVVKDYRKKGIGDLLLKKLILNLEDQGVDYFLLEVLENNLPAIKLYEKNGFRKTRKLECYHCEKSSLIKTGEGNFELDNNIGNYHEIDVHHYLSFTPSWQNDKKSIENTIENYEYAAIMENGEVAAYGLIHKTKGDIPQIGVLSNYREMGFESMIVNVLADKTHSNKIVCLNVQENDPLGLQLKKMGFNNYINQFEMIKSLKDK